MDQIPFLEFSRIISTVDSTVEYLRDKNLLHKQFYCCHELCSLVSDTYGSSDGHVFQCNVCHKRHSIRKNSFFYRSKLTLQILLSILYYFSIGCSVSECSKILQSHVSTRSIVQWYNYYRDVCTTYLQNNPVSFSRNCVLNVDETAIGGKRKYNRGRIPRIEPRWLFGIICSRHHKVHVEL